MQTFIEYLKSVRLELLKVTWPTRDEVYSSTLLVVSFTIILTLVVWGFDSLVNFLVYSRVAG
ncbi:preprotein translocase subunit SecE [Chitinivibrio alkaliphilus]|uniref:Protein translocase subunit SecE n=1 Tax=Chitinivibrio alkaliphilus ACht1 TaxID=1313304 RepID=U7D3E8_9BACT|nr:preprotein translocase, SecE subunit [Chitinivibrio alkaliphilus ACht1]